MIKTGVSASPGLESIPGRDGQADRRTDRITIASTRLPVYLLSRVKTLHVACVKLPRITPSGTDNRPVVDGVLLPDTPRALLIRGDMKRRRIMTGVVTEEWTRHLGMFLDDLLTFKW